jgi:multidrug efflux system membrane fusion protein
VPVVAAAAESGTMPVYLNGLGTVTSLNTVTVHTRVDGQLDAVMFREGDLVRKGELLAQIDPRPFQVQMHQAEGTLARDQAALKNAQIDLQRYQALFAQDAIPQQQLATQMATVTQDESVIKSDQAQVDNARLNLTYSRITAPITGRVGLRLVDPGNIVHASDPNGLIVITQRQPIGVLFTIPEDSLPGVLAQLRRSRTLAVEAWNRDMTAKLATGALLTVDNEIDPTTGTVRLKATFPNQQEALFPNQFVNARLLLDTLDGIVMVPAAAIQRNQQSTFVYVVKPDDTVELRTVDLRLTEGDRVAIDRGLAAGERVVVEGVDKLQPGMKVAASLGGTDGRSGGPGNAAGGQATSSPQGGRAHRGNQ